MENKTIIVHAHDVISVLAEKINAIVLDQKHIRNSIEPQGISYFHAVRSEDNWGTDYHERRLKEYLVTERLNELILKYMMTLSAKDIMQKDEVLSVTISAPEIEEQY